MDVYVVSKTSGLNDPSFELKGAYNMFLHWTH